MVLQEFILPTYEPEGITGVSQMKLLQSAEKKTKILDWTEVYILCRTLIHNYFTKTYLMIDLTWCFQKKISSNKVKTQL